MKGKLLDILKFLHEIEALKSVTRHSWTSSGRQESVPEHCWRMALMAMILGDEFPNVDIRRVIEMSLLHDLGELYDGDTPAFEKEDLGKHLAEEEKAVKRAVEVLPERLQKKIVSLCKEFNECQTKEAKLANALDKLEVLIQHNEADLDTWTLEEHTLNLTYGREDTDFSEVTKKLRELVDEETSKKTSK